MVFSCNVVLRTGPKEAQCESARRYQPGRARQPGTLAEEAHPRQPFGQMIRNGCRTVSRVRLALALGMFLTA